MKLGHLIGQLRAHPWLADLPLLGVAIFIGAQAGSELAAYRLRLAPEERAAIVQQQPVRAAARSTRDYRAISGRNLFSARCDIITRLPPRHRRLQPCSEELHLRATLVAEGAPDWSIALIHDPRAGETRVFSPVPGRDRLTEETRLVAVRSGGVVLERGDRLELCSMTPEHARSSTGLLPGGSSGQADPVARGIEATGDNSFRVARSWVDEITGDLGKLIGSVRVTPTTHGPDGRGLRIAWMAADSPLSQLGLQRRDVIQQINGRPLDSPEVAIDLYQQLRSANRVVLQISRGGVQRTLRYELH